METIKSQNVGHEKWIKINLIVLLIGGVSYSAIYLIGGDFLLALGVVIATAVMVLGAKFSQKNLTEKITIYMLTFVQYGIIVLFALLGGEFAGGFTLIMGVIAFNCVYFAKNVIIIQWIITDVIFVVSLFFIESLYGAITTSFLFRSFLGINFCILFLYILLNWIIKFKADSLEKENTSNELLTQVEQKMKEQEESALKIQNIFNGIKISSDNLKDTSDQMLNIASILSGNATDQTVIIHDLVSKSESMGEEIKCTKQMALDSEKIVSNNAEVLSTSNEKMIEAVKTISEMEASSRKINSIIKQIEDIAFQTNMLALNAAIEAARAGAAGKGFAVVAEEVQSLAAKSSEAANASSVLVSASISNVQSGADFIKDAASNMESVIEASNLSAKKVADISIIIQKQVETVEEIIEQMNNFMNMITQTSQSADQSNDIANEISEQITQINRVISI